VSDKICSIPIIDTDGRSHSGFIVFNEVTYPNFLAFLRHMSVDIIASDMSFAVSRTAELASPKTLPPFASSFPSLAKDGAAKERGKFEWAGGSAAGLFCQWSNFFNASHWRMVWDIIRFNYQSLDTLRTYQGKGDVPEKEQSIGQWLQERGYGDGFKRNYLIVSTQYYRNWGMNAD
jgi:predicted NAD/FAD-binding protein